jgi:alpha-tubulin suppressor-like RCC1 family protein
MCVGAAAASRAPGAIPPVASARARAIAAGEFHTCAVTRTGIVECWGSNRAGQLGDGTRADRRIPVAVNALTGVASIAAGGSFTCARTSAGGVDCWGDNAHGQLGGGAGRSSTPVAVFGLSGGVTAISAGAAHACALTTGGAVRCWGANEHGQLGDGTRSDRTTPVSVSDLSSGVIAIAAGGSHTCAVTRSGAVKCWGDNAYGQLGDGTTITRTAPVAVSGLTSGMAAIVAGGQHTCALTRRGAVRCWGRNRFGQLGDGTTKTRTRPTALAALAHGVVSIAAGQSHSCALTGGGRTRCWGDNDSGQLGDATKTGRRAPTGVARLARGVAAITAGASHTCALMRGGRVYCTGENRHGQLGDGTRIERRTRVGVIGFGAFICVVPRVLGNALQTARAAIVHAHCRVGTVTQVASAKKRNTVLRESPRPGKLLKSGARVSLTVSRGR